MGKGSSNAIGGNDGGTTLGLLLKLSHDVEDSTEADPIQGCP